jgi:pilus assembly protein TadC
MNEDTYRIAKRRFIIPTMLYIGSTMIAALLFFSFIFSPISDNLGISTRFILILSFFLICLIPAILLSKYVVRIEEQIIAEREHDESVQNTNDEILKDL